MSVFDAAADTTALIDFAILPDEVVVTETQKDKAIIVNLKVASSDIGKVIGKSGRIAKSIRAVVSAAASNTDKKVIVEIDN